MRFIWSRMAVFIQVCLFFSTGSLNAQAFSFNCSRDTLVPACPANLCITLKSIVCDIYGLTDTYTINPTNAYPGCTPVYVAPNDPIGTPTFLTIDDRYSGVIDIGFPFPFYGNTYTQLVASTNGYLSFDISNAFGTADWQISNNLPSTSYDRAMIMGPMHDLDPSVGTSPTQRIQYQTWGAAPHRRWILSFYRVPLFAAACNPLIENTHQIILYESTGVIEVTIFDKQICNSWNSGRAMIGIQNFARNQGMMVPGRAGLDPPWGSIGMNESWRFVPNSGASLFKRVELYDLGGSLIATGTTAPLGNGQLDVSFPNICAPANAVTSYIIRAVYEKIDDPTVEIFGTDTVRVSRLNGLVASGSSTPASCGLSDGTITVNPPSGGTPPYQYSLDGITWQSSNTFTGLLPGPYTVYVRDNGGICAVNFPVTVNNAGALAATYSSTPTACAGVNDGTITITSAGGSGPYSFAIDGGAPVPGSIPFTFINLTPTVHSIVVTDLSTGCASNTLFIPISTGAGVVASFSTTPTTCIAVNDGTITVNAITGIPPFTYRLDGGAPQSGPNPFTFTNVSPGSHTVIVQDSRGCSQTLNPFVVSGSLTATWSATATSCSGAVNGTVTVTPTSGNPPYLWSIDGSAPVGGASPYTFTNLLAGSHTVIVTDASGCATNTINVFVSAGLPLTATTVPGATSCSGASNGTITVTPTNGTAPYTWSIDGAAAVAGTAPYTFNNLIAGPHTIIISDASGCTSTSIIETVIAGPPLTTTSNKTDVACNGGATASITVVTPTMGTPPFEYSLNGTTWQFSPVFNGLIAGPYTVYYRESNGCQGSHPVTITEPTSLLAGSSSVPVICNGQSNGIITVTATGGVAPYQYSIDGGTTWQVSNVFTVPAGIHTITIRDNNNCTTTKNETVTEPAILTASSVNSAASCDGGNDGTITITVSGGNSGYQYSLDGTTFQSSNIFNVGPGPYTVTVKDNLGCITSFPTNVILGSNFTMTPQVDPTICEGTSTQLQLTSNATVYSWSPATALSNPNIFNPVANPTVTTEYIVTATLGRCSANDTVMVYVNAAPIPNAGPDGFICYGQTYQLQGTGGTQFTWTPSTYLSSTTVANPVSTPVRTITYTLSEVIDGLGCKSLTTDLVTVDVTPPIKVKAYPFDTIGYPGEQFQLLAVTTEPNVTSYTWSPVIGLNNPTIPNPVVTVGTIGDDIMYQVTASTNAGCKGEAYLRVRSYKGPDIYVVTGFTPNGDGKNDKFTPFPVGIKELKYFRIFNRWGQLLFSTNQLKDGWDGTFSGREQPTGVYVWMAEAVTNDNKVITKKGTVTIIR